MDMRIGWKMARVGIRAIARISRAARLNTRAGLGIDKKNESRREKMDTGS